MRRVGRLARDGLSANSRTKRGAQGTAIAARHSGGLFFGFFLLAAQKKETRPWVREPTFKTSSPQALKTLSFLWREDKSS